MCLHVGNFEILMPKKMKLNLKKKKIVLEQNGSQNVMSLGLPYKIKCGIVSIFSKVLV